MIPHHLDFGLKKASVVFTSDFLLASAVGGAVSKCFNAEHLYAVQRSAVFVVFLIVVDAV